MNLRKTFYFFVIYTIWLFFKVFYRLRVYGKNHIIPGGALIAANHVSFLDPPIIAISSPEELHFLAKRSLFKSLLGKFLTILNSHPVQNNKANVTVIKLINELIKKGHKVLLFPEGTRSKTNQLQEIKPGIGLLLSKSRTAIIPAYIHGTFDIWRRDQEFPKLFGKTAVVFGTPILWKDYASMEKKEAQELIAHKLSQTLMNLRKWYEEGAFGDPP